MEKRETAPGYMCNVLSLLRAILAEVYVVEEVFLRGHDFIRQMTKDHSALRK